MSGEIRNVVGLADKSMYSRVRRSYCGGIPRYC
jgi:hypothetical protein